MILKKYGIETATRRRKLFAFLPERVYDQNLGMYVLVWLQFFWVKEEKRGYNGNDYVWKQIDAFNHEISE
jgi:hypothetical protein